MVFIIIFLLQLGLFIKFDKAFYGTIYSPAFFMGVPFFVIITYTYFFSKLFGFNSINSNAIIIWNVGYSILWLSSLTIALLFIRKPNRVSLKINPSLPDNGNSFISIVTIICLIVLYSAFVKDLAINMSKIGTNNFSSDFLGSGIVGHLANLVRFLIIYFIAYYEKDKRKYLIFIILIIILQIFYQSKTWIFFPILGGVLARLILNKIKLSLSLLLKILSFGIIIFVLVYSLNVGFEVKEIVKHFNRYIFSSTLSLSYYLEGKMTQDLDFGFLVLPFKNIINKISGSPIESMISGLKVPIDSNSTFRSTVFSFFGSIFIYAGIWKGIIYIFIYGLFNYFIFLISLLKKESNYFIIYSFLAAILTFSWFDIVSNSLAYFEIIVFGLLLNFLTNYKFKL